mgnify:CR=1 FL=1
MKNKNLVMVVLLVVVLGGAYWYGSAQYKKGVEDGKTAAQADIEAQQKDYAAKAGDDAAKAANPFKVANPLEGFSANPFEEAKNTLNPFQ